MATAANNASYYQRRLKHIRLERKDRLRTGRYANTGVIVSDPDPDGGFPAGAQVQAIDVTLRMGHFTTGTLMRVCGRLWRVRQNTDGVGQYLERVRAESAFMEGIG